MRYAVATGYAAAISALCFAIACGSTPLSLGRADGGAAAASPDGGTLQNEDGGSVQLADGGSRGQEDGGAMPGVITCGMTTCDAATQDCCVTRMGTMCGDKGSCAGGALSCSSAASCGNAEVCCIEGGGMGGGGGGASCAAECQGPQLCASDAECPRGETCQMGRGGFSVCQMGTPPPRFDGGPPPALDGGRPPPPGGDGGRPADTGLQCGRTSCDPATQDCCLSQMGGACVGRGACTTGSALSCTSSAICSNGAVCCAQVITSMGFSVSASCQSTCTAAPGSAFTGVLCGRDQDCQNGQTCRRVTQNVRICR